MVIESDEKSLIFYQPQHILKSFPKSLYTANTPPTQGSAFFSVDLFLILSYGLVNGPLKSVVIPPPHAGLHLPSWSGVLIIPIS